MKTTKTISVLILTVIVLVFTSIPVMAAEVPADKYIYTLSEKTGTQSEKVNLEDSDANQAFKDILAAEGNEVVLVKDGAEIKFTPKEKMSAAVRYYTVDGDYAGNLFWTIDGSEKAVTEIDANKTAATKLFKRYGGYTCDLYYVLSIGDAGNTTRIIYKVGEGTAAPATSEPVVKPAESAANPAKTVTAASTASKVLVDGKQVSFEAYNISDNNYFKLRDIAMAVNGTAKNFEVSWDSGKNAISLTPGKAYTVAGGELAVSAKPTAKQATLSTAKVYLDGKEIQLTAYTIGGNNYFKLRDIGQALGILITWDSATNTIGIDSSADM